MFTDSFTKNYNKNIEIGCPLLADVEYPEHLQMSFKDIPFLPENK